MNKSELVVAEKITKYYQQGARRLEIIKGVDLKIGAGEDLCIVGASGAGKSTLLHLLGTLDRPNEGRILFKGENLLTMNDEQMARFRSRHMGFVFQFHHLLPEFSAIENVMLPCAIRQESTAKARAKAENLLKLFGLSDRKNHFPTELSGGEQQRVAIARAIVNEPDVLFADEPTGNLDSQNSLSIQDLFFELKAKIGVTLVVVTHDRTYASRFQRRLLMADGLLGPLE